MKYRNKLSNVEYFIENGVVMIGRDGVSMKSHMSVAMFKDMVRCGYLVPMHSEKESFTAKVKEIYKNMRGMNIRYIAYCVDTGISVKCNTKGMSDFMHWISDRKRDYMERYPETLILSVGGGVIADQKHFTNFIVSGEWME